MANVDLIHKNMWITYFSVRSFYGAPIGLFSASWELYDFLFEINPIAAICFAP